MSTDDHATQSQEPDDLADLLFATAAQEPARTELPQGLTWLRDA